jgi:ribose transport system ATP-binding protein
LPDAREPALPSLDLDVDPRTRVSTLRVGQQQILEIARALALNARVIIMDEPTSAISEREVDVLFGLIEALKGEGVAIVYISHKMDEVFRIADQITVMRDGRTVGSAPRRLSHDDVVRMMVGRDLKDFFVQSEPTHGSEILRVEKIRLPHPDRPGDFLVKISASRWPGRVLVFG